MKLLKNKLTVAIVILSVTFLVLISQTIKSDKISIFQGGVGTGFNTIGGFVYKFNSGVKENLSFLFNFSKVKKENEELRKKNSELEGKLLEYGALKAENNNFREMFNFKNQRSEFNYIGCDIIQKSGGGLLDQFVINKGSKDGIKKQMVVITGAGLVGQVVSVSNGWSIVQTLANENLAVSVMNETTKENRGVIQGYKNNKNKLLAKVTYLPLESQVKKGDVISTSGLGGLYPKGIRIGYVVDVIEDQGKVMKTAIVQPYVDFDKIEEVFIVVPKNIVDVKY